MSYQQHQIELWRNEAQTLIEWGCNRVGMSHLIPHIHLVYRENMRTTRGRAFTNFGLHTSFSYSWVHDIMGCQAEPGGLLAFSIPVYLRCTAQDRKENVLHELAHVLANLKAGKHAGHKRPWKAMMYALGQTPKRCHSIDTTGLKRKQSRYKLWCPDRCGWSFTFAKARRTRRINQLRKSSSKVYYCPKCKATLQLQHWINAQEVAA